MEEAKLKSIFEIGETIAVEFKRCGNGMDSDVYETVCSFSNRFGGDIYCGVLDDGTVMGLPKQAVSGMIRNFIKMINNPDVINPTLYLMPEILEYEDKTIIRIHVPVSGEVHSYKKVIYDRVDDADVKMTSVSQIAPLYIRKQNIFTEQKVYKYLTTAELRSDLIALCRQRAVNKRSDHPWKNLSDEELLKSVGFYGRDYATGEEGYNLACVLALGKDDVIRNVCPTYKTDALLRKVNVDRYDDRELIRTNLVESYDLLIEFGRKHLWDKFYMEGVNTISLRDKIVREMVSNVLMHREFTSPYVAKFVIENDRMYVENACRASMYGELTPEHLLPVSKNPVIASFFNQIGNADELGSGTRNLFKYTKIYSGQNPVMLEGDIFQIMVPLDNSYSFDAKIGMVREPAGEYTAGSGTGRDAECKVGKGVEAPNVKVGDTIRESDFKVGEIEYKVGNKVGESEHKVGDEIGSTKLKEITADQTEGAGTAKSGIRLSENQQKILAVIAAGPESSAAVIAGEVGISSRKVEANIRKLKDMGVLERIGSPRKGYWRIRKEQ